jgi:hypothetical protein
MRYGTRGNVGTFSLSGSQGSAARNVIEPGDEESYKQDIVILAACVSDCDPCPRQTAGSKWSIPAPKRKERAMKSPEQVTDDVMGSSVATQVVDAVRHAVFAGALALPMALLAAADGVESDSDFASAGELWLDVQNRMQVATERNL